MESEIGILLPTPDFLPQNKLIYQYKLVYTYLITNFLIKTTPNAIINKDPPTT